VILFKLRLWCILWIHVSLWLVCAPFCIGEGSIYRPFQILEWCLEATRLRGGIKKSEGLMDKPFANVNNFIFSFFLYFLCFLLLKHVCLWSCDNIILMSFVFFWLSLFKFFLLFVFFFVFCFQYCACLFVCLFFCFFRKFCFIFEIKFFFLKIKFYHAHADLKEFLWNIHLKKKIWVNGNKFKKKKIQEKLKIKKMA
jgi:hypothetical protein